MITVVPCVVHNDKMVMASVDRWSGQAIWDVPLAIREVSLGGFRQLDEAGPFGGYYAKKGSLRAATGAGSGNIGVTAAQWQRPAPSTLEIAGRLRLNLPYHTPGNLHPRLSVT